MATLVQLQHVISFIQMLKYITQCHGNWSTLIPVKACCLTAPSHYLNQCWHTSSVAWGLIYIYIYIYLYIYIHHQTGSALVQIMACHLFGANPSPEPILSYCQLDHQQQTCEIYMKMNNWKDAFENVVRKMSAISFRLLCINYNSMFDIWSYYNCQIPLQRGY